MNKVEQLLVRACKSKNAKIRLKSVYNRFYWGVKNLSERQYTLNMSEILGRIVDKYCPLTTSEFIHKFESKRFWEGYGLPQDEIILDILISQIAFTEAKRFPGLKMPLALKNMLNAYEQRRIKNT